MSCSGRIRDFKKHKRRTDLDAVLLVNVIVTPLPLGESISIDHLWVLSKKLSKLGADLTLNNRIYFEGSVYKYKRLGGKSLKRCLLGSEDYGIQPLKVIL